MEKQTYKIELESQDNYDLKKEWNMVVKMSDLDFLALLGNLTTYIQTNKIEHYVKPVNTK